MKPIFGTILCLLLFFPYVTSQIDPLKEANLFYDQGLFHQALIYLNQVEKINNSAPLLYKRGVCHYQTNQLNKSIGDFQRAWEYGYNNDETDRYLGLIHLHRGEFYQAAEYFKKYLLNLPFEDPRRQRTRKLIKQCGSAIEISYQRPLAVIESPGALNGIHHDFKLVESPSVEGRYYFCSTRPLSVTSLQPGSSDIFSVSYDNNQWGEIVRLPSNINSGKTEVLQGFTMDSNGIYYFESNEDGGMVVKSVYEEGTDKKSIIKLPFDIDFRNADLVVHRDALIVFSSNQLPGFGGYDLFYSVFDGDEWGKPVNLGSAINSSFDETSPHLASNGRTLFYSSNRPESVGGFDIFSSEYQIEARLWSQPSNMGIPINSPGDERHFSISQDGLKAYFSSSRKNAKGGFDVFIARFKDPLHAGTEPPLQLPFVEYSKESLDHLVSLYGEYDNQIMAIAVEDEGGSKETMGKGDSAGSIKIGPIFYNSPRDVLNHETSLEFDRLADFMRYFDETKLELIVNSDIDGHLEVNLYRTFKIGQMVEAYLVEKGVSQERIVVKGFGQNYPLIKSDRANESAGLPGKFNPRIELKIHGLDDQVQIEKDLPEIAAHLLDPSFSLYEAIIEDAVTYKIQIALVNQMYSGMVLDAFNDTAVEEHPQTGLYAYTIGLYDNYAEALQVKRDLEKDGLTDVVVVPYIDGLRIREDDVIDYVNEFPDLKNYLNYGN